MKLPSDGFSDLEMASRLKMAGKYMVGGVGGLVSYVAGNYYLDGSKET